MWIGFTEWIRNVKIFVPYVNAHQRVTSEDDDFNNPVDTVACSVCQSAFFPLDNGLRNKGAVVAGMEATHGLGIMDFHSVRLIWPQPPLSPPRSPGVVSRQLHFWDYTVRIPKH